MHQNLYLFVDVCDENAISSSYYFKTNNVRLIWILGIRIYDQKEAVEVKILRLMLYKWFKSTSLSMSLVKIITSWISFAQKLTYVVEGRVISSLTAYVQAYWSYRVNIWGGNASHKVNPTKRLSHYMKVLSKHRKT